MFIGGFMTFVTLFPGTENIHLVKDVGMIPYIMYKHYGYNSYIITYNNSDYYYLNNEVKGLKIKYLKPYTKNAFIDSLIYLIKESKKINVLHLFHLTKKNFILILIYKIFNRKGKIYLKLDADYRIKKSFDNQKNKIFKKLKIYLVKRLFKFCNIVSIESTSLYKYLNTKMKNVNIKYVPNGFYDYNGNNNKISYDLKENIICTVGRIGTEQKANEILLQGFRLAYEKISSYKLLLVGPIEKSFLTYYEEYIKKYPYLSNNIELTGPIYDRDKLYDIYKKTKIFCLTSKWESFAIVLVEALRFGCYIVSTNFDSAYDITNNQKYGTLFNIDNYNELSKIFSNVCNNEKLLKNNVLEAQEYAYKKFYWPNICKTINDSLIYKC